jgi:hypothetical protein
MSNTNAFIKLTDLVDRFMLRYKISTDDAIILFEHAGESYRKIRLMHSNEKVTAKVSINALGIIEMPDDMMTFIELAVPKDGEWWSFTNRPNMVNTTTMVSGAETRDSTFGEQVAVLNNPTVGYGAKGGTNDYNYTIDWNARRIFVDGIKSDTAVLIYTSSGLNLNGETLVPETCVPTIEAYMLWKKAYWDGTSMSDRVYKEQQYKDELLQLRIVNFMPTGDELNDIFWSTSTQAPTR